MKKNLILKEGFVTFVVLAVFFLAFSLMRGWGTSSTTRFGIAAVAAIAAAVAAIINGVPDIVVIAAGIATVAVAAGIAAGATGIATGIASCIAGCVGGCAGITAGYDEELSWQFILSSFLGETTIITGTILVVTFLV